MMLITVPVFLPLIRQYGYDPIWFSIIVVIVIEVGLIHPPVGMNLFVIQAQAPEIRITNIYRGIVPFVEPLAMKDKPHLMRKRLARHDAGRQVPTKR